MSTRQELLDQCRELNIKGCSAKKKEEIIKILEERNGKKEEKEKENKENPGISIKEKLLKNIKELKEKVCENCNEIGHNKLSKKCKINIENDNKTREKIRQYILTNSEKSDEEVAEELGININKLKQLSVKIPFCDFITLKDIEKDCIDKAVYHCSLCNKKQFNLYSSSRKWKEHKQLCDCCWAMFDGERESIWNVISEYQKVHACVICKTPKKMQIAKVSL
jgi:hypothetical protein